MYTSPNTKYLLLCLSGLLLSLVLLNAGCDERAGCMEEDRQETIEFTPTNIASPLSEIDVFMEYAKYIDDNCEFQICVPADIRYTLYGRSRTSPESNEEVVENGRAQNLGLCSNCWEETFVFETPAFTDYRLVIEGDTPECTREKEDFIYEYTFSILAELGLKGVVYTPNAATANEFGSISSGEPTPPTGSYTPPLTFEIMAVDPLVGTDFITIDPNTGVLTATDLINAGIAKYAVDVKVTDGVGEIGVFPRAFFYNVEIAPGQITSFNYPGDVRFNGNTATETVSSGQPVVEGDPPFAFSFGESISSDIEPHISIDESTGIVTADVAGFRNQFQDAVSRTFRIPVVVSNSVGSFERALFLTYNGITLIYDPNTITQTSFASVSSNQPTIVNSDRSFTFTIANNVPGITIDPDTGVITSTDVLPLEFGEGTYTIDVRMTTSTGIQYVREGVFTVIVDLP